MQQPEALKMAVREIARLVNFGWIDKLTMTPYSGFKPHVLSVIVRKYGTNFIMGNVQLLTTFPGHALSCIIVSFSLTLINSLKPGFSEKPGFLLRRSRFQQQELNFRQRKTLTIPLIYSKPIL
jgi:hypothetical protein